ncbi:MAG: hypothetical protein JXQ89_20985 [Pelagimonas sp.]
MSSGIDYGKLMHRAMRSLIQEVLVSIQKDGLPGEHHFFITFDTGFPDVEIAPWLRERYPNEMTVVIQHWFEDLEVDDNGFAVTLNFGETPERLAIPYDAIQTFVDPSVEFGLRFESHDDVEDDDPTDPDDDPDGTVEDAPHQDAEVVSLDRFRK